MREPWQTDWEQVERDAYARDTLTLVAMLVALFFVVRAFTTDVEQPSATARGEQVDR